MRYRYLDDFRRGISVFAIFSYGIAVLGTPQCPPPTAYPNSLASVGGSKIRVTFPQVRVQVTMIQVNE